MKLTDFYPLVVVADPVPLRDWYVRHLGFSVGLQLDWVVYLTSPGRRSFGLCLMRDGLQHQIPELRSRFQGNALVLTLEVEDAVEALREVQATGIEPEVSLRDEQWGQRHFMLRDPAGIWIDVVQPIEPDTGWLDKAAREQLAALNDATG